MVYLFACSGLIVCTFSAVKLNLYSLIDSVLILSLIGRTVNVEKERSHLQKLSSAKLNKNLFGN